MENYSVLMSVYDKERPDWLEESMNSMWGQTWPPSQMVLICDGPLTEQLDRIILKQQTEHENLSVIRLPENKGLAGALNEGLRYCRYEYVARMDSDDLALPDRVQRELLRMEEQQLDIVSGCVGEFVRTPKEIAAWRRPPETPQEIQSFYLRRNPFNHPAVIFRKSVVEAAGKYEEFPYFEDYQLWIKILSQGGRGGNLQEPVLYMRAGENLYRRRGGYRYWRYAMKLEKYKRQQGLIGWYGYWRNGMVKGFVALMPASWREKLYQKFLR